MTVVFDERVSEFVQSRVGKCWNPHTVVGCEKDGVIVAGALYERFNGHNVYFHGASDRSRKWATPGFIKALFQHPFIHLGAERMSTPVAASNVEAQIFDLTLGFEEEFRQPRAAYDGGDLIWFVMWKEKCKWLSL